MLIFGKLQNPEDMPYGEPAAGRKGTLIHNYVLHLQPFMIYIKPSSLTPSLSFSFCRLYSAASRISFYYYQNPCVSCRISCRRKAKPNMSSGYGGALKAKQPFHGH
ncbi:hypothetical protein V6N12_033001 [Hibiscus sabdariffa]|uniref:Uncharacterized protein n=1 Tax=Hibiscus sabdariffa TaxID=183260 RepID=A0ABR1ZGS7_9ROSI